MQPMGDRHEHPLRVGPYDIVRVLGEGGMGVVYCARLPGSSRQVAIKTVPVAQENLLASMRREIYALGRLVHPGVVRVLMSGVEAGRPWYAMELLQGATLAALRDELWGLSLPSGTGAGHVGIGHVGAEHADLGAGNAGVGAVGSEQVLTMSIMRGPVPLYGLTDLGGLGGPSGPSGPSGGPAPALPPADPGARLIAGGQLPRVLTITRRLLTTLAYVHGEGIVHRDLKPQNVFLRGTPDDEYPVLVDFGVASRAAGVMGREVLDVALEIVGTPAYMAPEQIRGDAVDSRGDLYALGCVLYELCTGRPPFGGNAALIMERHLVATPVPISALVAGCPPALDQLVLALLEKRPRDRIGHAEDVIHLLDELGARPEPPLLPRPRAYVYRPGLAGRDDAMTVLDDAARDAARGQGGIVLIAGESGVGKTYLATEAARATTGFQVVAGTCAVAGAFAHGPGGEPLQPFGRLFQVVVDRCTALGRGVTDRLLGPRGKILAEHEPLLAKLPGQDAYPDPLPLHGAARRDRLLAALADTLAAIAEQQPLLLVLDDLQWADDVSLRLLTSLPDDWFRDRRVLIVGTYRVEETTAGIGELLARPYTRRIYLGSLDRASVGSLVADMLAVDAPPPALIDFLAHHSRGNPFFVAEYLRTATAEGLLRRGAHQRLRLVRPTDPSDASADVTELALPLTMPELVGRRLDGLSPVARRLATYASVIGRELDLEVLATAAGATEAQALEGVAELVARQVLEPTDDGALRFVHDKLCEIAYERQDTAELAVLHGAVGDAIFRRVLGTPEAERLHAVLAHHFLAAGDEARAIRHLEAAGERALALASYTEARDLHRKLIDLDDRRARADGDARAAPARRRARWERRLGEACFNLGDIAGGAAGSLEAMRLLGRAIPTTPRGRAAEITRMLARQARHRLARRAAGVLGERGGGERGRPPTPEDDRADRLEVALAATVVSWRCFFHDDMIGVIAMSLRAVDELESASPPIQLAPPYVWLGYTAGLARMPWLARAYFADARAAARATDDTASRHFAAVMEAVYHIGCARWAECEALNRTALAELQGAGDPTNVEHHLTTLGNMEFYIGRFEEAVDHFEQLRTSARARRNLQHEAWGLFCGCKGRIALGRFDEALPRLDAAWALLERLSDPTSMLITLGLYAQLHTRAGHDADARRAADEISARLAKLSTVGSYASIVSYTGAAETYLELAERARRRAAGARADGADDARELLRRARAACAQLRRFALLYPFAGPAHLRYRAQLAALEGHPRAARRGFARSIAAARRLAMPYDEAQALWLASRYAPEAGAEPGHAEAAREIFTKLRCAWHLEQLGAPAPAPAPTPPASPA